MYGIPVVVLGLAAFSILMNMAHLSNCPNEANTAKESTLKMSSMEQRLMTLEQELLENTLLLEKFLQALDNKFEALKLVHMPDVQQRSHEEAVEISQHLARGNPPPIPQSQQGAFEIQDNALTLGQEIDNAFLWKNSEYGSDTLLSKSLGDYNDGKVWEAQWDPANDLNTLSELSSSDLVLNNVWDSNDLGIKEDLRDPREKQKECIEWKNTYNVVPQLSWGDLPLSLQEQWVKNSCDFWIDQILTT